MNDRNKIKCKKKKRCNKLTTRKKRNSYLNVMSMIKIVTLQNEILQTYTIEKTQTNYNKKSFAKANAIKTKCKRSKDATY